MIDGSPRSPGGPTVGKRRTGSSPPSIAENHGTISPAAVARSVLGWSRIKEVFVFARITALCLTLSASPGCASNLDCRGADCVCRDGRCVQSCTGGGCNLQCMGADCQLDCPGGGCQLDCSPGATRCVITSCGADCRLTCGGAGLCSSSCGSESGCLTVP